MEDRYKISKDKFYQFVRITNPYGNRVYWAIITWAGYDYSEDADNEQDAKDKLWNSLRQFHI